MRSLLIALALASLVALALPATAEAQAPIAVSCDGTFGGPFSPLPPVEIRVSRETAASSATMSLVQLLVRQWIANGRIADALVLCSQHNINPISTGITTTQLKSGIKVLEKELEADECDVREKVALLLKGGTTAGLEQAVSLLASLLRRHQTLDQLKALPCPDKKEIGEPIPLTEEEMKKIHAP